MPFGTLAPSIGGQGPTLGIAFGTFFFSSKHIIEFFNDLYLFFTGFWGPGVAFFGLLALSEAHPRPRGELIRDGISGTTR